MIISAYIEGFRFRGAYSACRRGVGIQWPYVVVNPWFSPVFWPFTQLRSIVFGAIYSFRAGFIRFKFQMGLTILNAFNLNRFHFLIELNLARDMALADTLLFSVNRANSHHNHKIAIRICLFDFFLFYHKIVNE